jgi:uncharacterized protein YukE
MTMSAFGFDIPKGDPGALTAASTSWRNLGLALVNEGEAVAGGARTTLGSAGWQGPASTAFADNSERLMKAFTADAEASGRAASALSKLSDALAHAQQVAGQALADCGDAQGAVNTHQQAANDAGKAAQAADEQAAGAVHPTTRSTFQQQADQARQQQTAANNAASLASDRLMAAQARGQQAVTAYEHEAQAIAATLNAAAGELEGAEEVGEGWAKPLITWLGHANDFGGAGAVGLIKGYDAALSVAAGKLDSEISSVLGDDEAMASIMGGKVPAAFDGADDPVWDLTKNAGEAAGNPLTRALSAGPSEESFGLLGKVPYLAYGLTALDMYQERNEGVGKAVVEPLGNLAISTGLAEGTSALVAPAIASGAATLAAGDGALAAIAGTAFVPGVGEVVIVGAVVVIGTYAIDKGIQYVWDHRAAIGHALQTAGTATVHGLETAGTATVHGLETAGVATAHGLETAGVATAHGLETAGSATVHGLESAGSTVVHTTSHVVHDIEPWNWG